MSPRTARAGLGPCVLCPSLVSSFGIHDQPPNPSRVTGRIQPPAPTSLHPRPPPVAAGWLVLAAADRAWV